MIPKHMLNSNWLLKPSYPNNLSEVNVNDAYKEWFCSAMIEVNRYIELLHKQLVRKGRVGIYDVSHPFYPNAYVTGSYDITSHSGAPYHREEHPMGLNQFFSGGSPYEYGEVIFDEDTNVIRQKMVFSRFSQIYKLSFESISFDFKLCFDFSVFNDYKELRKDMRYIFEYNLGQIFKLENENITNRYQECGYSRDNENNLTMHKANILNTIFFAEPIYENNEARKIRLDELKIPDKTKYQRITQNMLWTNIYYDFDKMIDDFLKLNPNLKILKETTSVPKLNENGSVVQNDGSDVYKRVEYYITKDIFDYEKAKEIYSKYKFLHPLYFDRSTARVIYVEPYIADRTYLKPLYMKGENIPFGRRDKWLVLWEYFYEIHVANDTGFWESMVPFFTFVISIAAGALSGGAGFAGVFGASGAIGGTAVSAVGVGVGALGGALGVMGSMGNIPALKIASLGINIVTAGANIYSSFASVSSNLAQQGASKISVLAEASLEIASNTFNVYGNVLGIQAEITANKNQNDMISDESEDDSFTGKEDKEKEEDLLTLINPNSWYNLETAKIN